MKELNYKYQVIEERLVDGRSFYKAKDVFEDDLVFVEKHKEAKDMDWDESSKIEKELEELKGNKTINDFFYASDYDKNIKIFYKVYKTLEDNPFEKPKEAPKTSSTAQEEAEELEASSELEDTKEKKSGETPKEDISTSSSHYKEVKEVKTFSIQELGGKVKLDVKEKLDYEEVILDAPSLESIKDLNLDFNSSPQKENYKHKKTVNNSKIKDEDIFTSELLPKEKVLNKSPKEKTIGRVSKEKTLAQAPVLGEIPKQKTLGEIPNYKDANSLDLDFKKSNPRSGLNNKIICKRCEVEIQSKHLNIEENIAYCTNCHSIREIKKLSKHEEIEKQINQIPPDGIKVKNSSSMLYIETSLNALAGVGLLLSSVGLIIFSSILGVSHHSVMVLIMYIIAGIIGYKGAINIFNTIFIEVTKDNIKLYSKPLMHFSEKNYSSKSLSQLYVKEYIHKNKNNVSYSYKLRAILKNGKDISILKLDNSQYMLFLERSIESWLQIEDRRISGEYK